MARDFLETLGRGVSDVSGYAYDVYNKEQAKGKAEEREKEDRKFREQAQTRAIDEMIQKRADKLLSDQMAQQNIDSKARADQAKLAASQEKDARDEQFRKDKESNAEQLRKDKEAYEKEINDRRVRFQQELASQEDQGYETANRIAIKYNLVTDKPTKDYLSVLQSPFSRSITIGGQKERQESKFGQEKAMTGQKHQNAMELAKLRLRDKMSMSSKLIIDDEFLAEQARSMVQEKEAELGKYKEGVMLEEGRDRSQRTILQKELSSLTDALNKWELGKGGRAYTSHQELTSDRPAPPIQILKQKMMEAKAAAPRLGPAYRNTLKKLLRDAGYNDDLNQPIPK